MELSVLPSPRKFDSSASKDGATTTTTSLSSIGADDPSSTAPPPIADSELTEIEPVTAQTQYLRRQIPSSVHIRPITAQHVPSFRRLLTTLLPIRYPDSFYSRLLSNPDGFWLSHVATWAAKPSATSEVVGGICARLEPQPNGVPPSAGPAAQNNKEIAQSQGPGADIYHLYLSHIGVLAPYRSMNLATAMLEETIGKAREALKKISTPNPAGKKLSYVYAHVWEGHNEALEWYKRRGFKIEPELVKGYYRKLKPGGARIVRRKIS